jgi:tellurite resistance protein
MIIFGTRGVTYSSGKGNFNCPQCRCEQPYNHKRVRRFFTLYFIPLIPFNLHGEYIECGGCKGTFRLEVLDFDPTAGAAEFEAEFHRAIKRVMVEMMLADGAVDEEEVAVIKNVYGRLAGTEISDDDVRKEIVEAETRTRDVAAALVDMAGNLNDNGKEMVVKAAFLVAAADGQFQEEEKELIGAIGQALQMTPAHMNGVIASMMQDQGQAT